MNQVINTIIVAVVVC